MTVGYELKNKDDIKDVIGRYVKTFEPPEIEKALAMLEALPDRSDDPRFAAEAPVRKQQSRKKSSKEKSKDTDTPKTKLVSKEEIADATTVYLVRDAAGASAFESMGLTAIAVDLSQKPESYDWSPFERKHVILMIGTIAPFIQQARWLLNEAGVTSTKVRFFGDDTEFTIQAESAAAWTRFHNGKSDDWLREKMESLPDKGAEERFRPRSSSDELKPLTNHEMILGEDEKGKETKTTKPLPLRQIAASLSNAAGSWPRSVDGMLFVLDHRKRIRYLKKSTDLFTWIGEVFDAPANFETAYHTRDEFFAYLLQHSQRYDTIEHSPHFPPWKSAYYCHDPLPDNPDGSFLNELIEFFNPETPEDRTLLLAFILTLAWGGPPGKRPAFLIEADGQGSGKSVLAHQVAKLFGGYISLRNSSRDFDKSISRILTPSAFTKRMLLMDNLKTLKLSVADLESLITEPVISGHRIYHGEAVRPNNLTLTITANSPSLGADLSERVIVIKIRRSKFSATWDEDVLRFVETNRVEIWADVMALLSKPSEKVTPVSRFGMWEEQVLGKLPGFEAAQRTLIPRQKDMNADFEALNAFEDDVACRLNVLKYEMGLPQEDDESHPAPAPLADRVELDCVFIQTSGWLSGTVISPGCEHPPRRSSSGSRSCG